MLFYDQLMCIQYYNGQVWHVLVTIRCHQRLLQITNDFNTNFNTVLI